MSKVLIILNHNPTDEQIFELKKQFNIKDLIFLPEDMKDYLTNIPPEESEIPKDFLEKLTGFILKNLQKSDFIWIQTEYGMTFYIVDFALKKGYIPIYSTTKRVYEEKVIDAENIERKYLFKHVRFRKYIKSG